MYDLPIWQLHSGRPKRQDTYQWRVDEGAQLSPNEANVASQGENIADHGGVILAYSAYGMF